MKKYIVLLCVGLLGVSYSASAKNCDNAMILQFLEDLLRNSNLILPKTTDIQERIGDCTLDDAAIISLLDGIDACCDANGSQLDVIESIVEDIMVSSSDGLDSMIDVIESRVEGIAECCASSADVLGEVTDIGSCLDSMIDVPDDINNLTLTVIGLLKTILLDLRGCNIP